MKEPQLIHLAFKAQALRTPDRIALRDPDASKDGSRWTWTYKELDDVTDRLASLLKKVYGIDLENPVAILSPVHSHSVISMLAILKTGGCFVPIEPAYPAELISDVLTLTKPKVLITVETRSEENVNSFSFDGGVVYLNDAFLKQLPSADQELLIEKNPDNLDRLFFIAMSSGTTGAPKGILQLHRSAANSFLSRMNEDPYNGNPENCVEACNIFFIWEALRPVLFGATCSIIREDCIYDADKLLPYLKTHNVTNILFTPSLLEMMSNQPNFKESVTSLRFVSLCGEVVSAQTYRSADGNLHPDCKIFNSYSISETFDVAGMIIGRGNKSPPPAILVGRPLKHCHLFVLDEQLNPCPAGVDGDIYVAGDSLARSYLAMDELTKAKFVPIPSSLKSLVPSRFADRMYNCGDVGSWEGELLRVGGRSDTMIKIRGYSVELGAITTAIENIRVIQECCVIADGDRAATNKTLVAYVVLKNVLLSQDLEMCNDFATLRRFLVQECRRVIPSYSIPSVFIVIDRLPVNQTSGKTDTKSLPNWRQCLAEQIGESKRLREATISPTERIIVDAVNEVLDIDENHTIDPVDSFFEVGGHSLTATAYLKKLKCALTDDVANQLSLEDIFRYPTFAMLAKYIERLSGKSDVKIDSEEPDLNNILEVLVRDVKPIEGARSFWRNLEVEQMWSHQRVLITGCTGFLGSHLLATILKTTNYMCYVLVRDHGLDEWELLGKVMKNYHLLTDVELSSYRQRIKILVGDLSRFDLGLGHDHYIELTTRIDCVIHTAAQVNLMMPYSTMRVTNVTGTQNILNFCTTGHIKQLHYISTNGVIPLEYSKRLATDLPEADPLEMLDTSEKLCSLLPTGYSQTKWLAEQVCRKYQSQGLPCVIYRIGNIGGNPETGVWNEKDTNLAFLRICTEIKAIPTERDHESSATNIMNLDGSMIGMHMNDLRVVDDKKPLRNSRKQSIDGDTSTVGLDNSMTLSMEVTNVKFICDGIIGGTTNIRKVAGKTIHLIQPNRINMDHVYAAYENVNIPLQRVTPAVWYELLLKTEFNDDIARRFSLFLNSPDTLEDIFGRHVPCQTKNYKLLFDDENYKYPEYTTSELTKALKGLVKMELLPMNTERPKDLPLLNRLIVVTGASSGIGAAVCEELVSKGANLIILARREQRLEDLRKKLLSGAPTRADTKVINATVDVTNSDAMIANVERAEMLLSDKVWGLVHCAGIMNYMRITNAEIDLWHKEIDINCKGTVNAVRAVLPSMTQCNRGHVICISSDAGKKPFDGLAVYSGTKAFVEFFCEALRREVAPTIKVSTVAPGDVKTELTFQQRDAEAMETFGSGPQAEVLEPSDVAESISFILTRSDRAAVNSIIVEPREAPI